jgi:ankyrin repeat protein
MKNFIKIMILVLWFQGAYAHRSEYTNLRECAPIHQAAYTGDIAQLEKLIKAGADINDPGCHYEKFTPLGIVAWLDQDDPDEMSRSVATAKWLIEHGANIEIGTTNPGISSPLILAVLSDNIPLVRLLCDKGANKEVTHNNSTLLMYAAGEGNGELFNLLLSKGANPQAVNTGEVPAGAEGVRDLGSNGRIGAHEKLIHAAVNGGNLDIIKAIIEKNLQKVNEVDAYGDTSLHYVPLIRLDRVSDEARKQIVEYLISKGANKNALNNNNETAYDLSVKFTQRRNPDMPAKWVDRFAWVRALKTKGKQVVPSTMASGKKGVLFSWDAPPSEDDISFARDELAQCSVIHKAAVEGNIAKLEELIKSGANVDDINCGRDKTTPLGMVVRQPTQDKQHVVATAQWLIDHGANIKKIMHDPDYSTPPTALASAVGNGDNAPLVALLCDRGADKDEIDGFLGWPMIMDAIGYGLTDVFNTLLAKGASVQGVGSSGQKIIHLAAQECNLDILKTIIEKGLLRIDEVDSNGNTPLHYTVMQPMLSPTPEQRLAVIKYLISKKANIQATNSDGKTAYDIALEMVGESNKGLPDEWLAGIPWVKILRPPAKAAAAQSQSKKDKTKK